ncbi:MAG: hypothetical protein CXZ00_02945 [Acidobacteria bacterium]|nr:MAG: hypothetical protein CXZ00_02945 [Acidobacteriota bacterium]
MRVARFSAIVLLIFTNISGFAQSGAKLKTFFPMEPGTRWVYRVHLRTTIAGSNQTYEKRLTWPVEVKEAAFRPGLAAALLSGFPSDLIWYQEGRKPKDQIILQLGKSVYIMPGDRDTLDRIRKATSDVDLQALLPDVWFQLPLKVQDIFCPPDQPQRDDTFYCWFAEGKIPADKLPNAARRAGGKRGTKLAFRTHPDHEIYTLVPGIGVVRYGYAHHGTADEVQAELVRFKR